MRIRIVVAICSLLFSAPAFAADTNQFFVFAPDGHLVGQAEMKQIYEVAKMCESQIAAAVPQISQQAKAGDKTSEQMFVVLRHVCMESALDVINVGAAVAPKKK